MENILRFLDNRKAKILGITGVIIGLLTTQGIISPEVATAILSILSILAGGASMATDKALGARRRV